MTVMWTYQWAIEEVSKAKDPKKGVRYLDSSTYLKQQKVHPMNRFSPTVSLVYNDNPLCFWTPLACSLLAPSIKSAGMRQRIDKYTPFTVHGAVSSQPWQYSSTLQWNTIEHGWCTAFIHHTKGDGASMRSEMYIHSDGDVETAHQDLLNAIYPILLKQDVPNEILLKNEDGEEYSTWTKDTWFFLPMPQYIGNTGTKVIYTTEEKK